MNEIQNQTIKSPKLSLLKKREERVIGDSIRNYTVEIISLLFWFYLITKLFIFDIDLWFLKVVAPSYSWIVNFKLIYFLGLASIIWLWIGTRDLLAWLIYIAFYPLILVLIRLPYYVIKQRSWILAFSIMNSIASFFKNLRYSLVISALFLASLAIILYSNINVLILGATILLTGIVLVIFIKHFIEALRPTAIFQLYSKFINETHDLAKKSLTLDSELKSIPIDQLNEKQLERWNSNLQASVLFNRVCLFSAKKLREYQRSDWRIIPSIFGLLRLIILTVIGFSGIYYALYLLSPDLYKFGSEPSFFNFIYFSFNNLIFNSTSEVVPIGVISQSVFMLQSFLTLIIVLILVTLIISNRAQRSSLELDEAISSIEAEGRKMESFIQDEYKIPSIQMAIDRLKDLQSTLYKLIYWFTKGIDS